MSLYLQSRNKNLMLPVKTLFLPERELFFDPLLRA
jgi:hypothetical protein